MNIVARPWEPQDLIDDLQMLIDEEPINYLNGRCATLCMARDYLKEHFSEPRWICVEERLPEVGSRVIARGEKGGVFLVKAEGKTTGFGRMDGSSKYRSFTHWMPLPEPPEVEV
jgi:hypothetical protein